MADTPYTARDLITLAFKEAGVLGVGQDLLAQDVNDGLTFLRGMMGQWQERRYLVPNLVVVSALGNGAVSNTIGPAGHWAVTKRPDVITSAYVIQENTGSNPVSLPLRQIFSRENYNLIAVKTLSSLPTNFFYDGAPTLGNVFVWPIPNEQYRIYLTIKADFGFPDDSLDTELLLPTSYEEAIRLNLAIRVCSAYGRQPKAVTVTLAKMALATIKASNAQISELSMPAALTRGRAFSLWNADGF